MNTNEKNCFNCDKFIKKENIFHITELKENGRNNIFNLCEKCIKNYIETIPYSYENFNKKDDIEIIHIKTQKETYHFINGIEQKEEDLKVSCECGTTQEDIQIRKSVGCSKCYDHFEEELKRIIKKVQPNMKHMGKRPKKLSTMPDWDEMENNEEKLKLLKLYYAKALELEEYEKLSDLKSRIDRHENR